MGKEDMFKGRKPMENVYTEVRYGTEEPCQKFPEVQANT